MDDLIALPVGKLTKIQRDWEFRQGWVRAPLREIVCNDRLTRQARIVWLWLLSVEHQAASWGECETLLRCGTKTRRNCLMQLVQEGYIEIHQNGVVDIKNPYEVFDAKRQQIINEFRETFSSEIEFTEELESRVTNYNSIIVMEKKIDEKNIKSKKQPKPVQKSPSEIDKEEIIKAWNECKPQNYSKIRTVSQKQAQCIKSHLTNLGLSPASVALFICAVCSGLKKSEFWSKTVDQSGRNFNSVFGYGAPQDTKMKNIENLYSEGQEESTPEVVIQPAVTLDQQELIDAYKYSKMNLQSAISREDDKEVARWQGHVLKITEQLSESNISAESI